MKSESFKQNTLYPVPRSRRLQLSALRKYCDELNLDFTVGFDPHLKVFDIYTVDTNSFYFFGSYRAVTAFLYGSYCQKFRISSKTN